MSWCLVGSEMCIRDRPNFIELENEINQIEKSKSGWNNPTKLFDNLFKIIRK
jgi:hypothetical protein